ncbi:hypothetical protein Tco_0552572, partial [Tanacetum coccineum]
GAIVYQTEVMRHRRQTASASAGHDSAIAGRFLQTLDTVLKVTDDIFW